jgi:hypothetical protein
MARSAHYDETELAWATLLIQTARTLKQLRRGQALLVPALTGASMDTTATLLGVGRNQVCVLRRQLRAADNAQLYGDQERRGGRRRELLSLEEEKRFVQRWINKAKGGRALAVTAIHLAFEKRIGKRVPKSTIYRMLGRHGWPKITPKTRGAKADAEPQDK